MFESTLSRHAQKTLAVLGKSGIFTDAYLAGGSALALHFGHRISVDFDFFTPQPFDPKTMSSTLRTIGSFEEKVAKGITLIGLFEEIQLSCFQYAYPLLQSTTSFADVAVAHPYDIAAMKLVAISDRSTKKDYVDLYELVQQGISLDVMLELYQKKYGILVENIFTLIKSLRYFEDIDQTEMPKMLKPLPWDSVKSFFIAESIRLGKKYLEDE